MQDLLSMQPHPWIIVTSVAVVLQLVYYLLFFSRLARYDQNNEQPASSPQPVSVIICAHNEITALQKNLPVILSQSHPHYEVVVVDDCSNDGTTGFLDQLAANHPRLMVIHKTEAGGKGKRAPLTLGITKASYDRMVLTDADCRPTHADWLLRMTAPFDNGKQIVLGFGAYERKTGWLNRLVRFDTYLTALQYFSFHLSGMTYMGVGRNLAYTKDVFKKSGGLGSGGKLLSGDDDLFVNRAIKYADADIRLHPDSWTISAAPQTFTEWIHQKRRHVSTGPSYRLKHKMVLGLFLFSQTFFYVMMIGGMCLIPQNVFQWSLILMRLLTIGVLNNYCLNKSGGRDLFLFSPVLDLFFAFFYPVIFTIGLVYKTRTWKTN
ncbi:MAG: glycosyltransferase [Flavobacteriales bacterium]|nr:glycosyltransferase [Flavobacteriales bacterium]